MKGHVMKKASALAMALLCSGHLLAAAHDNDSVVSWRNIVGVISAPNVDNPVGVVTDDDQNILTQIHSGTLPWVARTGTARVNLRTSVVEFTVRGLVLVGGNASGTAGPINQVIGKIVCNPGSNDINRPQGIFDTAPVTLSATGNASFSGELTELLLDPCDNPLFLIRIGPAFGDFAGRWLATGVEPYVERSHDSGRRDRYDN
jgi:hypothetical protein